MSGPRYTRTMDRIFDYDPKIGDLLIARVVTDDPDDQDNVYVRPDELLRRGNCHDELVNALEFAEWHLMGKARRDPTERKVVAQISAALANARPDKGETA